MKRVRLVPLLYSMIIVLNVSNAFAEQSAFRSFFSKGCAVTHYGLIGGLSLLFNWDTIQLERERSKLVEKMDEVPEDVVTFIHKELRAIDIDHPELINIKKNPYFCFEHQQGSFYACHGNALLINDARKLQELIQKEKNNTLTTKDRTVLQEHREQIRHEAFAITSNDSKKLIWARLAIPWLVQAGCYLCNRVLAGTHLFSGVGKKLDRNVVTFCTKELGITYLTTAGELALMIFLLRSYNQHRKRAIAHRLNRYRYQLDDEYQSDDKYITAEDLKMEVNETWVPSDGAS